MGATRSNPITASNQKLKASPDADRCAPPRFRARPLALIGDDITNSAPAQQRVECVPAVWPGDVAISAQLRLRVVVLRTRQASGKRSAESGFFSPGPE